MPRPSRFNIPGLPQHVIVRGNNRDPILASHSDFHAYLDWLKKACLKHRCALHAYVLMTNHVHLFITPSSEKGLGKTIQMVGRYYVQYFNHEYRRTGTLWEGRYKASLIDSERYFLTCSRYIELNPVRARMVEHPSEYPWSSYRHNALGELDSLLCPHETYTALGITDGERQTAYRQLFNTHIEDKTLSEIRDTTQRGWVLGSDYFIERIESRIKRPARKQPRGGDRRSKQFQDNRRFNRN